MNEKIHNLRLALLMHSKCLGKAQYAFTINMVCCRLCKHYIKWIRSGVEISCFSLFHFKHEIELSVFEISLSSKVRFVCRNKLFISSRNKELFLLLNDYRSPVKHHFSSIANRGFDGMASPPTWNENCSPGELFGIDPRSKGQVEFLVLYAIFLSSAFLASPPPVALQKPLHVPAISFRSRKFCQNSTMGINIGPF